jgi:hypothetical protein
MRPFLHGFVDELTKLAAALPVPPAQSGQFKFKVNKPTGPAGPVAKPKPFGFGGGPTSGALKAVGRQQMTFAPARKKRPDYIPVGTQKFEPKAKAAEPVKPKARRGGRRRKGKDLGPTYGDLNKITERTIGDRVSKGRVSAQKENEWFQKNTPRAGGGARKGLSPADQKRYDRLKGMGNLGRHEAATGAGARRKVRDTAAAAAKAKAKAERSKRIYAGRDQAMHDFATSGAGKI